MKNHYVRTALLMAVGFAWLCAGYTTAAAVNDIAAGVTTCTAILNYHYRRKKPLHESHRNYGQQVLMLPKTSAVTALSVLCETARDRR